MKSHQIILSLFLAATVSSGAVTREEMDHARAIAAKEYLRYANNGSDYLDKLQFSSMAELESKLKAKEKENIVDFKKVSVPSDYASWDKAKLVEYWGTTFFKSSSLSEKGKVARSVVARKVGALEIAAPKAEEKPAPENAAVSGEDVPQIAPEDQTPAPSQADIEARLKATEDSLAALAQQADAQTSEQEHSGSGGTTIYIVILGVLIAAVIALVVYASKVFGGMGKKNGEDDDDDGFEIDRHKRAMDSLSATIAERDAEIRALRRDLQNERNRNSHLENELAEAREEARRAITLAPAPRQAVRRPREIFLARAGRQGIFTRADKEPVEDISVFRLVTTDGVSGTFDIIDDENVIDAILDSPHALLDNAVKADIPDNTDDITGIETDSAGTAVFEEGRWRVVRKARLTFV